MLAFLGAMAVAQEKEWQPCSVPNDFLSGCRRAASFPFFGDHSLAPISVLKVRSQSESEGLNKLRFAKINLEPIRIRNCGSFIEETSDGASDDSSSSSEDGDTPPASPVTLDFISTATSARKSVRFADDCGKELFCVKVMSEPSDQPPYLSPRILRRWRGDTEEEEKPKEPQPEWKMLFKQPACDYLKFRETLEGGKVALENIVIKPEIHKILGTIKVMNIAFEKKVFVRTTQNNWKSYVDHSCVYQPSASKIHDTFTFELEIPKPNENIHDIEFCICYVGGGEEHWDSNGGINFMLHCEDPRPERRVTYPSLFGSYKALDRDDAYRMHQEDWSGFASWRNLSTDAPYW